MQFVDTHAHLYLSQFDSDRHVVVENAIKNKVNKIFIPNIDSATIKPMLKLCKKFANNCFPMIGLHPTSVKRNSKEFLYEIEDNLKTNTYYAIGETGIDLYWSKEFLQEQKEAFNYQIKLSQKFNLPLIIHIRNSFDEVIKCLNSYKKKPLKGIFHCFSGTLNQANKAIELGFLLGIGGIITFKNSNLSETIKKIKLDHIVLETDSPYLAPHPYRGKRNESKYIPEIAKKIAEIYNTSIETIAEKTTQNALNLFNIN